MSGTGIGTTYDDSAPATPGCVAWPTPQLAGFPCGPQIDDATRDAWAPLATEMTYADTGYRYPGVQCTEAFTVCKCCICPGWCDPCHADRIDLYRVVPWPILELVELVENGVVATAARLAEFHIAAQRWLVRSAGSWPLVDMSDPPGTNGTAHFRVRYGRRPPHTVVMARDQLLYLLIMHNAPVANTSGTVGEEIVVTESTGRQIVFTPQSISGFQDWVKATYGLTAAHATALRDPAIGSAEGHLELVTI